MRAKRRFLAVPSSFLLSLALIVASAGPAQAATGWVVQDSPVTTNLNAVDFVDANHGWICGAGGVILATADGGEHWTIQSSGTGLNLEDISFTDMRNGMAVGQQKIILRTTNAGSTWSVLREPVQDYGWSAIEFLDQGCVWCVGTTDEGGYSTGTAIWSTDGGADWDGTSFLCQGYPPHNSCSASFTTVSALGSGTAFVAGYKRYYDYSTRASLYRTTDGGSSFEELLAPGHYCSALQFLSPMVGYAQFGSMSKSTDGGAHWQVLDPGISVDDFSFIDTQMGWAVGGDGGIARTIDGGDAWMAQDSGTLADLRAVDFISPSVGAAVGTNGTILHTVTGGQTGTEAAATPPQSATRLLWPSPNPAGADVRISYDLSSPAGIALEVFDPAGRWVRTLDRGNRAAGLHRVVWNGRDASGHRVARGAYFVRLLDGSGECFQRVLLVE